MSAGNAGKEQLAYAGPEKHFLKTKLCKFFTQNRCTKGELCSFAHSRSEMKPCLDFFRTKMCPKLVNVGHCEDGFKCKFAHHKDELRKAGLRKKEPNQQRNNKAGGDLTSMPPLPWKLMQVGPPKTASQQNGCVLPTFFHEELALQVASIEKQSPWKKDASLFNTSSSTMSSLSTFSTLPCLDQEEVSSDGDPISHAVEEQVEEWETEGDRAGALCEELYKELYTEIVITEDDITEAMCTETFSL